MFLRELHLRDVRSIVRSDLVFTDPDGHVQPWNVLLGENGTGKSTVLRAAAMVLAGRSALPAFLNEPDSWVRNGATHASITAILETAGGSRREVSLRLKRGASVADVLEDNKKGLALLDAALAHAPRNYFVVGYGVARHLSGAAAERPQHPSRFANVATLFSPDEPLVDLTRWAIDLEYRKGKLGTQAVKQTLDGLLPGATFRGIHRESRSLIFKTDDGVVPLTQLSDGYQSVAAWVGDMLFRITETFGDYRRPLDARGVLLMDEIELHLHPRFQRDLRAFLRGRFKNFQVLATTHSALTAQQCAQGELWVVQRDARAVPDVVRYDGSPERLQVQHLLLSDAFGLGSLSSPKVEEYKRLSSRKRDSRENRRFAALADELRDGDVREPDADLREMRQLVSRVDKALSSKRRS